MSYVGVHELFLVVSCRQLFHCLSRADLVRPISIRLRRGSAIAATNRLRQRKLMEELLCLGIHLIGP